MLGWRRFDSSVLRRLLFMLASTLLLTSCGVNGSGGNSAKALMLVEFKGTDQEVKTFRETQKTLVTVPYVLRSALIPPEIKALVKDQNSPVEWLTKSLSVEYVNDSDILQVSLSHPKKQTAKALVNAVTEAYLREVAQHYRGKHAERLEVLRATHRTDVRAFQELSDICDELATKTGDKAVASEYKMKQLALEELKIRIASLSEQIQQIEIAIKLKPPVVLIQYADIISK